MSRTGGAGQFLRKLRNRARNIRVLVAARDAALNRRWRQAEPGILLVRHARKAPWFYAEFLDWLALNFPEVRERFELALLDSRRNTAPAGHRLLVPWLQDPIQQWSPKAYGQACAMADSFMARDIPVINPPAALAHGAKSHTLETARTLGIRAGRSTSLRGINDLDRAASELGFPFIVRPDWGHGYRGIRLDSHKDIRACSTRLFDRIGKPVAIQFVDTTGTDGLFRKYRYLAAGNRGVSVHLLVSAHWEVRGDNKIVNDAAMAEELAFITAPNPHAGIFDRLRRALGLDLVAFDYGHDRDGNLVLWEANPYPYVAFGADSEALRYRTMPVHRCFAAMACLYLDRAALAIPPALAALADEPAQATTSYQALHRPE